MAYRDVRASRQPPPLPPDGAGGGQAGGRHPVAEDRRQRAGGAVRRQRRQPGRQLRWTLPRRLFSDEPPGEAPGSSPPWGMRAVHTIPGVLNKQQPGTTRGTSRTTGSPPPCPRAPPPCVCRSSQYRAYHAVTGVGLETTFFENRWRIQHVCTIFLFRCIILRRWANLQKVSAPPAPLVEPPATHPVTVTPSFAQALCRKTHTTILHSLGGVEGSTRTAPCSVFVCERQQF